MTRDKQLVRDTRDPRDLLELLCERAAAAGHVGMTADSAYEAVHWLMCQAWAECLSDMNWRERAEQVQMGMAPVDSLDECQQMLDSATANQTLGELADEFIGKIVED